MLIKLIVGRPLPFPTGQERITRMWDAILWRMASLPGLDATVILDGRVHIFRKMW